MLINCITNIQKASPTLFVMASPPVTLAVASSSQQPGRLHNHYGQYRVTWVSARRSPFDIHRVRKGVLHSESPIFLSWYLSHDILLFSSFIFLRRTECRIRLAWIKKGVVSVPGIAHMDHTHERLVRAEVPEHSVVPSRFYRRYPRTAS